MKGHQTRFGFPVVLGDDDVALIEPLPRTFAAGVHSFDDRGAFGYRDVELVYSAKNGSSNFPEIASFRASRSGMVLEGKAIGEIRRSKSFQGESAQLALLLALYLQRHVPSRGWKQLGVVWTTGIVRSRSATELQLAAVMQSEFSDKLRAFARQEVDSKVFICPDDNWKSEYRAMHLQPVHLDDLRGDPKSALRGLVAGEKLVILVPSNGLNALLEMLFDSSVRQFQVNWRTLRKPIILAAALFAPIWWGIQSFYLDPPCVPMDWHCFVYREPSFSSVESGILIEQKRFMGSEDLLAMVQRMEFRLRAWQDELARKWTTEGYSAPLPKVRVVAVSQFSEEAMKRTGALFGVSGQIEQSGTPSEIFFHDSRILINVTQLSSERAREVGRIARRFQRVQPRMLAMISYYDDEIEFAPGLLNTVLRTKRSLPINKLQESAPALGEVSIQGGGPPQNLNWSYNGEFPHEFSLIEQPSASEETPQVFSDMVIPSTSLKAYFLGLMGLRRLVDECVGGGPSEKSVANEMDGAPERLVRMGHQIIADYLVQVAGLTLKGDAGESRDPKCAPGSERNELVHYWTGTIQAEYLKSVKDDAKDCASCYVALAKLGHCANDAEAVIRSLSSAIDSSVGEAKAKLVHQLLKYRELMVSNDPNLRSQSVSEINLLFDQLRDQGYSVIADFEQARWISAWGPEQDASVYWERVLSKNPKHALSRFLRIKASLIQSDVPQESIVSQLKELFDDIQSRKHSPEELYWLGSIDSIWHAVPPTAVFEDLIDAMIARCDEGVFEVIRHTRGMSDLDWSHVVRYMQRKDRSSAFYLFPSLGQFHPGPRYVGCPELLNRVRQTVTSILAR